MLPAVPEDNCVIQPALKPATDRLHSTTECQLGPGAASIQEETLHSSAAHAACVRHQPCLLHKEHTSPVFSQPVHLSAAHASCICHNQHSNRPATGHNPARTYNTHNTPAQRNERADAMRAVHHATSHDNTQITIHACSCRPRLRATSQLHSLHAGCSLSEWHKAADWPKITAELAGFAKACPHPTHCISCKVQTRPNRHAASPQLTPAGQRELERCSLHLSVHCMGRLRACITSHHHIRAHPPAHTKSQMLVYSRHHKMHAHNCTTVKPQLPISGCLRSGCPMHSQPDLQGALLCWCQPACHPYSGSG